MVRHIVFFKLPKDSKVTVDELKEKLLNMKDKIEVLLDLEVGVNFSESPRAFDLALVTDFKTKEDLKTYSTHPVHLPVVEWIKENSIETKVVDYER